MRTHVELTTTTRYTRKSFDLQFISLNASNRIPLRCSIFVCRLYAMHARFVCMRTWTPPMGTAAAPHRHGEMGRRTGGSSWQLQKENENVRAVYVDTWAAKSALLHVKRLYL